MLGSLGGRAPSPRQARLWRPLLAAVLLLLLVQTSASLGRGVGLAWTTETVEEGNPTGLHTSIALDERERPHMTYRDKGSDSIKYARLTDNGWTIQVVGSKGEFAGDTDLVLDDSGRPHVSFFSGYSGYVVYATWNGSSWLLKNVERALSEGHNSLALDSLGRVHLAYTYINGRLRHAVWNETEWRIETIEPDLITVRYISMAIDSLDNPHIAYQGFRNLHYASWNGTAWSTEIVDANDQVGWFASLILDSRDRPHIAYRDAEEEGVMYGRRTASGWILETVDPSGDTGWDVSIAVDGQDGIHLSYYERTEAELRHAYRAPDTWWVEEVDSRGVVGWHTDLALDSDGFPHISYYDWSRGSLKYARAEFGLSIRTLSPREVTSTSVVLRGELVSLGGVSRVEVSFEWRPKEEEVWRSTVQSPKLYLGTWEAPISNLTAEQEYEFRAKVESSGSILWGETLSFRTPHSEAKVPTPFYAQPLFLIAGFLGFLFSWVVSVIYRTWRKQLRT